MSKSLNNLRDIFSWRLFLPALFIGAVIFYGDRSPFSNSPLITALAQTDPLLERRISQLEQRFYSIETRIRQLEMQSRSPVISPGGSARNDLEVTLLRSQFETLQRRLLEVECGVLRVDERTLTPAAREARRKSGTQSDPCRLDSNAPVRLSARP